MLSSVILASSVLAQAALGVKIYSTADVGAENSSADLAVHAESALAQIDTVAASLTEQREFNEDKQVNKAIKKALQPSKKPNVDIDLQEMGGGLEDRFRETYRQREQVTYDLDGNVLERSGSGSASGSWSANGSGSYENSRGSGSWALSASMSFSVSFEHNWSAHTPSPGSIDPPVPIEVNPCECCDCGDGAWKVPLLFERKTKGETVPVRQCKNDTLTVTGEILAAYDDGCPAEVRNPNGELYRFYESGWFSQTEQNGKNCSHSDRPAVQDTRELIRVEAPACYAIEVSVVDLWPNGVKKTINTMMGDNITFAPDGTQLTVESVYPEADYQVFDELVPAICTADRSCLELKNAGTRFEFGLDQNLLRTVYTDGTVVLPGEFWDGPAHAAQKTISALAQTDSCAAVTCDCAALADVCAATKWE